MTLVDFHITISQIFSDMYDFYIDYVWMYIKSAFYTETDMNSRNVYLPWCTRPGTGSSPRSRAGHTDTGSRSSCRGQNTYS